MTGLHLTNLGANMTEIRYGDKYVFFSYQTPVAYSSVDGSVFVTNKKYSNTTSKHIKKWVNGRSFTSVSQETIDNIVRD